MGYIDFGLFYLILVESTKTELEKKQDQSVSKDFDSQALAYHWA